MPRGDDYRISLPEVLAAHREHLAGWSLRALARMGWRRWGYASAGSALEGLRGAFRALDLPVRGRIDAVVLACEIHGNLREAFRDRGHPDHARYLEQSRLNQARRRAA